LGSREALQQGKIPPRAVIAIDSPQARGAWINHLKARQFELPCVVHPSAVLGRDVQLGEGSVLLAGSIVQSGTWLGRGVIINSGAIVDHDCRLDDLVHVAQGAMLAGNVQVGARSSVGIGACVIQGIIIGPDTLVGPGSAVVDSLPARATAVGVPARIVRLPGANPIAPAPSQSQPQA
jgi:sugar O-acyltransferase (sialic acid O-acetyltransferase NeuD family)